MRKLDYVCGHVAEVRFFCCFLVFFVGRVGTILRWLGRFLLTDLLSFATFFGRLLVNIGPIERGLVLVDSLFPVGFAEATISRSFS